jgi:hypothetical protein
VPLVVAQLSTGGATAYLAYGSFQSLGKDDMVGASVLGLIAILSACFFALFVAIMVTGGRSIQVVNSSMLRIRRRADPIEVPIRDIVTVELIDDRSGDGMPVQRIKFHLSAGSFEAGMVKNSDSFVARLREINPDIRLERRMIRD